MAFEFPFSLAPKTTAKAAEVMGNFNAIKTLLTTGLPTENLKDAAVTAAKIAAGAIGHAQLAAGYGEKATFGSVEWGIGNGSQLGAVGTFAHGLGVAPQHVEFVFVTGAGFAITLEGRLLAWDNNNITWQAVSNSPMPGEQRGTVFWRASVNA